MDIEYDDVLTKLNRETGISKKDIDIMLTFSTELCGLENGYIRNKSSRRSNKKYKSYRVYFAIDIETCLVKIGTSAGVRRRMRQLKYDTKHKHILLGTIAGTYKQETNIHEMFKEHRVRDEYFALDDTILNYIMDNGLWRNMKVLKKM